MEHFVTNAQIHENSLMGQQIGSFPKNSGNLHYGVLKIINYVGNIFTDIHSGSFCCKR